MKVRSTRFGLAIFAVGVGHQRLGEWADVLSPRLPQHGSQETRSVF